MNLNFFRNSCGDLEWSRWLFCFAFWASLILVVIWTVDREPPFEMAHYNIVAAKRGTTAQLKVAVNRTLSRQCNVEFSRYLYDAKGYRYDFGPSQTMTAEAIRMMDKITPNEVRIAVPLDRFMAPGRAKYVTSLEYTCNPVHRLWPIPVTMELDIEVME